MLKFSLILGTVGRTTEPRAFLASLARQTYPHFEVIVIDQNTDDAVAGIIADFRDRLALNHQKAAPGLSKARNLGLQLATGDIIAFPDDDCWYPDDTLAKVAQFFETHPQIDGLTGRAIDANGVNATVRWSSAPGLVDKFSVWRQAVSFSIFLRRQISQAVGHFDENLGVGAGTPWGSGEETDYLIRALQRGAVIHYDPALTVFHPQAVRAYDAKAIAKGYSYGQGYGYVLKKHAYPTAFVLYNLFRPLAGGLLALIRGRPDKAGYHFNIFKGRYRGWRHNAAAAP